MAVFEPKKKPKQEVNEEMVDKIIEETKRQKNFKERMYDKVNLPVWVMAVMRRYACLVILSTAAVAVFCSFRPIW